MSRIVDIRHGRTLLLASLLITRLSLADSVFDEPQWLVGVIAIPEVSVYAGTDDDTQLIPYIAWTTERWHLGIDKFSYERPIAKDLSLELLAKPRFGSSGPNDKERYGDIERDFALELGAAVSFGVFPFDFEAELLADSTGTHDGYSAALSASLEIPYSSFELTASAGAIFRDQSLTQHLFGVTASQATSQINPYSPEADWSFEVGIEFSRMLSKRCALIAQASANILGSEARRSPLTDRDVGVDGVIGVLYVY